MTDIERTGSRVPTAGDHPEPRAILDGSGDTWEALTTVVERFLKELDVGQILEVILRELDSVPQVTSWCQFTGHELVSTSPGRGEMLYWIRKQQVTEPSIDCNES
ncbi:MAG: sulfurtransferase TusA family protein [Chloroflexota bacterium]|nr:sulfurtransferase TusA family protein [Chloroflexota bacterium]